MKRVKKLIALLLMTSVITSVAHPLQANATEDEKKNASNTKAEVFIEVKSKEGDNFISGAEMEIYKKLENEKKLVESWITKSSAHKSELGDGDYILREKKAPSGYGEHESIRFSIKNGKMDTPMFKVSSTIRVKNGEAYEREEIALHVEAINSMAPLEGAKMAVLDQDGYTVTEWESTPDEFTHIFEDGIYEITCKEAPEGYIIPENESFRIRSGKLTTGGNMVSLRFSPKISFSELDATSGEAIIGSKLAIYKEDNTKEALFEWTTKDEPYLAELEDGKYILKETEPTKEYEQCDDMRFTVENGEVVGWKNDVILHTSKKGQELNEITIITKDEDGKNITGATYSIINEKSRNEFVRIPFAQAKETVKLPNGNYVLKQIYSPKGYIQAQDTRLVVEKAEKPQEVEIENKKVNVKLVMAYKKDFYTEEILSGATLELWTKDGTRVHEWVSQDHGQDLIVEYGEYILREAAAPSGYAKAKEVTIKIGDKDTLPEIVSVSYPVIRVAKTDQVTGDGVAGAKLMIKNKDNKTMYEWTSTGRVGKIGLEDGTYILSETETPEGYYPAEDIEFVVADGHIENDLLTQESVPFIKLHRIDGQKNQTLKGSEFTVYDENREEVEQFKMKDGTYLLGLEDGTYSLRETKAPYGYELANEVKIVIENHRIVGESENIVLIESEETPYILVCLINESTGGFIKGASMAVLNKSGKEVATWKTTDAEKRLELQDGDYILRQKEAPEGFKKAADIPFTIENGTILGKKIRMFN